MNHTQAQTYASTFWDKLCEGHTLALLVVGGKVRVADPFTPSGAQYMRRNTLAIVGVYDDRASVVDIAADIYHTFLATKKDQ